MMITKATVTAKRLQEDQGGKHLWHGLSFAYLASSDVIPLMDGRAWLSKAQGCTDAKINH